MGDSNKIITVVLPAFNCAKTLSKTVKNIPADYITHVILVDDHSSDETLKIAQNLRLKHIVTHQKNLGYGANQKTCYDLALQLESDIIIMLHPDYQYDPKLIPEMLHALETTNAQVVLGSRLKRGYDAVKRGMPLYKYIGNRFLTKFQNIVFKQTLSEYHTGFRAFTSYALRTINYHGYPNSFIFDNIILINLIRKKIKIAEIYCPASYTKDSSSIGLFNSIKYGLGVIYYTILLYLLKK